MGQKSSNYEPRKNPGQSIPFRTGQQHITRGGSTEGKHKTIGWVIGFTLGNIAMYLLYLTFIETLAYVMLTGTDLSFGMFHTAVVYIAGAFLALKAMVK